MLKELASSIKAVLYERTVSPLCGVFVGFWVVFNWKAIAVLFWSDSDVVDRITYIEALYTDHWSNLIWPLICSAVFLIFYPFVALAPFALWEKVNAWKVNLKQKYESTVTLTLSKSVALRKEMRDQYKSFVESMELKDGEIETSKNEKTRVENELAKLKEVVSSSGDAEARLVTMTARLADAESTMNEKLREANTKRTAEVAAANLRERELLDLLKAKDEQLSSTLSKSQPTYVEELEAILLNNSFRLFFNPAVSDLGKTKIMEFGEGGTILKGRNDNESSWRIHKSQLEFIDSKNMVHSRFWYNPRDGFFRHTNDPDTGAIVRHGIRDQYLAPEASKPMVAKA